MSDRIGAVAILLLVLVLPLSALLARRLPGRTVVTYTIVWVGMFILLFALVAFFT